MLCAERTLPALRRARPRQAPGTTPQPQRTGRRAPPARRPPAPGGAAVPPPVPRPSLRSPPRPRPQPRGNLKHGAPNRGFGQIGTAGTQGPSRPSQPGLRGRSPGRRPMLRLRAPAQPMLQRGRRAERARPRRGAQRTGLARPRGGPERRAGGFQGRAQRGAPAVRAAVRRRSHASAAQSALLTPGLPLVLRASQTGDPLGSPPAPAARKVTSAGQAARAPRRGD